MIGSLGVPTLAEATQELLSQWEKGADLLMRSAGMPSAAAAVEVGLTPHRVVHRKDKLRLLHYRSRARKVHKTPVLLVYALINKPYILDLLPGHSVVEALLKAGLDVYLLDWGVPDEEERYKTLEHYVTVYLQDMVRETARLSGSPKVSLVAYCQGGTLALMYTALFPEDVRTLTLMAAPVDFHGDESLLGLWGDPRHFDVDKVVDTCGNIPSWMLAMAFTMTKPVDNLVGKYVKLLGKLDDERFMRLFMAMERWVADGVPVPGELYRQFIKDLYQRNRLAENKLKLGEHLVDLRKVRCPLLNIIAEQDHLVPPPCSEPVTRLVGKGRRRTLRAKTGHVGLAVSGSAIRKLWPTAADWIKRNSGARTG